MAGGPHEADPPLHVFFLPYPSPGHMLPMFDMARRFADHGARSTIVATPANVARVRPTLDRDDRTARHLHRIRLLETPLPDSQVGLPDGWENWASFPAPTAPAALASLRPLFDRLLREHRPDCVVSDVHFPWTADSSFALGIPRLMFPGIGCFAAIVSGRMRRHGPHEKVSDDNEPFVVPDLPHRIELCRSHLPDYLLGSYDLMDQFGAATSKSYGVLMNTFEELEQEYVRLQWAPRLWCLGPLSLCNMDVDDRAARGDAASSADCLTWLDGRPRGSVLYLCFGSMGRLPPAQMREIAVALEASGRAYVWVAKDHGGSSAWFPEGFPDGKRGLIVGDWAPQILILNHEAIGGFVTHCGWNSCLEAISAGIPMVTWPLYAEQFFNERLVVDVLRVGVGVGSSRCSNDEEKRGLVRSSEITKAVAVVMGKEEESRSMRRRVEELKAMSARAVEVGGSSYSNMDSLIEELMGLKRERTAHPGEETDGDQNQQDRTAE